MTKMRRTFKHVHTVALLFALVSTGLVFTVPAKGGPPSQSGAPVTSIIDGNGVNTFPTLRIQSDLGGAYQNLTSKNSTSLLSVIQGIGDWVLDMLNYDSSPQRRVLVDLRDPVTGSGPNGGAPVAPFAYQIVRARFIANCSNNGSTMQSMQPNNIYPCPLVLGFDDASGVRYRLVQNPGNPGNYLETNWVQVTCVATDANAKCNQWKLEPSVTQLNGERKNVAKLLKVATKPNQSDQDMGDFYLSFTIHLTNP
jgi:hypothetical protein